MTYVDSILESRDITLPTNVCSQSYGFSISHLWMWELDHKESWAPKNWWFWTVVLDKTLESQWTARRSNHSILKEMSPEYSLEGLMLKLKLQYFGHLMWGADSLKSPWCWERLKAGGEGDSRGWDGWIPLPIWWTWVSAIVEFYGQRNLACCSTWVHK